jgi:hypothetical protein
LPCCDARGRLSCVASCQRASRACSRRRRSRSRRPQCPVDVVDPGASCRHVAEQKAGAMLWPRPHIDEADGRVLARAHHEARYDEARGRCFLEVYQHYTQAGHTEVERRQLYNAMSDELLAMTEARSGKQSGMVFDRRHRMTTGSNLG